MICTEGEKISVTVGLTLLDMRLSYIRYKSSEVSFYSQLAGFDGFARTAPISDVAVTNISFAGCVGFTQHTKSYCFFNMTNSKTKSFFL